MANNNNKNKINLIRIKINKILIIKKNKHKLMLKNLKIKCQKKKFLQELWQDIIYSKSFCYMIWLYQDH